jgi:hypothetical protein
LLGDRRGRGSELKATQVLALGLAEASAKVRTGPPVDDDEDMDRDVWAGELPQALDPRPDPQLAAAIAPPEHVTRWRAARHEIAATPSPAR